MNLTILQKSMVQVLLQIKSREKEIIKEISIQSNLRFLQLKYNKCLTVDHDDLHQLGGDIVCLLVLQQWMTIGLKSVYI